MKRLFIILSFIFFITGCSKENYFICKIDLVNDINEYKLDAIYKVYYKDTYVTKIEKEEIYTSENNDTLNYFKEYKQLEYTDLNNLYNGYSYEVKLINNKVKLNTTIDMSLVDVGKMIKNNYIDKDYVISGKISVGGIKNIYKEGGNNE